MILHSSEKNISKPNAKKYLVMFELSHCLRHKVILFANVLSQQLISLTEAQPI